MLNLSDKELDRLSREAAEKYEVEQDPAAWHKLEQLLENELGRSSPMPRFSKPGAPFLYAPAVIILITATYFLLKPTKHTETSTQKNYPAAITKIPAGNAAPKYSSSAKATTTDNAVTKPVHAPNENKADHKSAYTQNDKSTNATTINAAQKKITPLTGREKVLTKPEAGSTTTNYPTPKDGKPIGKTSVNEATVSNPTTINTASKNSGGDDRENREYIAASATIGHNKNNRPKEKTIHQKNKARNKSSSSGQNDVSANTWIDNTTDPFVIANKTTAAPSQKAEQALKPANTIGLQPVSDNSTYAVGRNIHMKSSDIQQDIVTPGKKNRGRSSYTNNSFQIGFLLSPDFSEVKYNYNNKIGSNIGITLSYQLSGRLSVNTGFVYNIKNYYAQGRDFHAPPGYWPNMYHLDFMEGNCHMYEIPLNLRYDFSKTGNTSFFINGGLSSYLMKKESYIFYAQNYNIGYAFRDVRTSHAEHNYWFSALNLSAGFETKISNSFSIQVEPYMKLPMTGIGLGKVDLSSYGINFQLKYAPVLKRSRR